MKTRKSSSNSKLAKKSKKGRKKNSEKDIIVENKKRFEEIKAEEIRQNEDLEEDDEEIEFSEGFEFNPITQSRSLENLPVGSSLEGGLIFAPRIRDKNDKGGKNYSETKYDFKYDPKYSEKTPNEYAGKESSSDSSKESSNQ